MINYLHKPLQFVTSQEFLSSKRWLGREYSLNLRIETFFCSRQDLGQPLLPKVTDYGHSLVKLWNYQRRGCPYSGVVVLEVAVVWVVQLLCWQTYQLFHPEDKVSKFLLILLPESKSDL